MPFPIAAAIGGAATALGAGLGYLANRSAVKEQKKQRKLAERLSGVSCKNGSCSRKSKPQAQQPAQQQNLQQQLSPTGDIPQIGGGGNAFTGYNASAQQLPLYTPQQQGIRAQLAQQGAQNLNPDFLEQRATRNFYQNTVPTLAERFTSMGAGGQGSSDFRGALGAAGADLQSQLAALRGQIGGQQLHYGLQPSFENIYNPERQGILQSAASQFAPAATQLAGEYAAPLLQKFGDWALGGGTQGAQAASQVPAAPFNAQQFGAAPYGGSARNPLGVNSALNNIMAGRI